VLYTHCSDASSNWLLLCGWPKLCTVCGQMLLSIQNLQQKITTKIRAVKRLIFFSCSFNPHFVCYIFQFVCVPFSVIVAGRVGGGSTPQLFGRPPQLSHGNQPRGPGGSVPTPPVHTHPSLAVAQVYQSQLGTCAWYLSLVCWVHCFS